MRKLSILIVLALLLLVSPAVATPKAPLSSGNPVDMTVTIGSSAAIVLPADAARGFLQIQNVSQSTNGLACTTDGSTPAIGGKGTQLAGVSSGAGGTAFYDTYVPLGTVTCIGSASSTVIAIKVQN